MSSDDDSDDAAAVIDPYYPMLQWEEYPMKVNVHDGKVYINFLPDSMVGCGLCRMPYGASVASLAKHWRDDCLFYHAYVAARKVQKQSDDGVFKLQSGDENPTGGLFRPTFLRRSSPIAQNRVPPPRPPPRNPAAVRKKAVYPNCLLEDLVAPCSRSYRAVLPVTCTDIPTAPVPARCTRKKSASSSSKKKSAPRTGTVPALLAVKPAGKSGASKPLATKPAGKSAASKPLATKHAGKPGAPKPLAAKPAKKCGGPKMKSPRKFDEEDEDLIERFKEFCCSPGLQRPPETTSFHPDLILYKRERIEFLRTVAGPFFHSPRIFMGRNVEVMKTLCIIALSKLKE